VDAPGETTEIAQINVARLLHPWGDARVSGFTNALNRVSRVAHRSPGFVWQLEVGQSARPDNDPDQVFGVDPCLAVTLSVWKTAADLRRFVKDTVHATFVKRRAEWFEASNGPAYALWPVAAGRRPTLAEGKARLEDLAKNGPTARAFDFEWVERAGVLQS